MAYDNDFLNYGTLFVCSTPIGNLKDITIRALEVLKSCDYIAAEDTRHTLKLLNHYGIKNRLISCHEHNQRDRGEKLVALLMEGNSIALVSDAGTPCISDPGAYIIGLCRENGINVTVCPGACAAVSALVLSGLSSKSYTFEGFLPKSKKERRAALVSLKTEIRTMVLYEAPHKLKATLIELYEYLGEREIAICREITKLHEEVKRLSLSEAVKFYSDTEARGEFVLVVEGAKEESIKAKAESPFWKDITIEAHKEYYVNAGLNEMEAIKKTAKDRGLGKREVYGVIKGGKSPESQK